jgi:cyanophycinase-like exopeptidase
MQLVMIGGEEFADGFEYVHAAILSQVAGGRSRGVFLPTCATHDGIETVKSWCRRAKERLSPLSAAVETPLVVDSRSANDPANVALLASADWIYLGGGYPQVGLSILAGTHSLEALRQAAARGVLIIGASAGAMMMCARSVMITPGLMNGTSAPEPLDCLGFVPDTLCVPHFNAPWAGRWLEDGLRPTDLTLIGIDEQTALVHTRGVWEVLGHGRVGILENGKPLAWHAAGQQVSWPGVIPSCLSERYPGQNTSGR